MQTAAAPAPDKWHGVWGTYPIPERFSAFLNPAVSNLRNRRDALKATGEFYSWLHKQECSAAAAAMGRLNRQRQRAAKAEEQHA